MPVPWVTRYTNTPRYGKMSKAITQAALAHPDMSRRRNKSPKTMMSSQNHTTKRNTARTSARKFVNVKPPSKSIAILLSRVVSTSRLQTIGDAGIDQHGTRPVPSPSGTPRRSRRHRGGRDFSNRWLKSGVEIVQVDSAEGPCWSGGSLPSSDVALLRDTSPQQR